MSSAPDSTAAAPGAPEASQNPVTPTRAGTSPRHHSSWAARLHRRHDQLHHSPIVETEPLLGDAIPGSDVEAQEERVEPRRSKLQSCFDGIKAQVHKAARSIRHSLRKAVSATNTFASRHKKPLTALGILLLVAALVPLGIFTHNWGKGLAVCTTAAAGKASDQLLRNFHSSHGSIDACTGFDKMACGGFMQNNEYQPEDGYISTTSLMVDSYYEKLSAILQANASDIPASCAEIFVKVKMDYDSCMDQKALKDLGLNPLQQMTDDIRALLPASSQSWRNLPVLSESLQHGIGISDIELTNVLLYLWKRGIKPFLALDIKAGNDNPNKQAIYVSPPPTLGLPVPEYYDMHTRSSMHATASLLEDYQALVEEILGFFLKEVPSNDTVSALGQKIQLSLRTTSRSGKIGENVVAFEAKLAAAYPSKEKLDGCSSCYTPMLPTDVAQILPQLELGPIIGSLAPYGYAPDQVIVASPAYLKTLSRLLSSTPKETLQAYLVWKAVQEYYLRVEDPKLLPLQAFNARLRGQEIGSDKNRHKVCLRSVDDDLQYALGSLFLEMGVKDDYPGFGRVLASEVHNQYVELLQEADWMSEDVRESMIEMINTIEHKIASPVDPDILWQELDALTITNSFFDNKVEAEKYRVTEAWSHLEKPSPPHIDVVPAWTPQKRFLHPAECLRPLSYGAFGQMSGRILASNVLVECPSRHGIWDHTTRAKFQRRADCFVDQYSKFSTAGPDGPLSVNGILTLRQNIADATGLRAAFRAWKKHEKDTPGNLLPGMEMFTPDQLLFIRYAQQWCEKNSKENARYQHYTDPYHAPGHARILGTVANSEEFKEAFGCEKKETECKVW